LVGVALEPQSDVVTGGVVPCGGIVARWQSCQFEPAPPEAQAVLVPVASVAPAGG
jgi:hypothetical protein